MNRRSLSKVAEQWWDYTTLDPGLLMDVAKLTVKDIRQLQRDGFTVNFFTSLEEFYLAEAMEYISSWKQSTADNPAGICGPIGPTEQLPLVARIVNSMELDVRDGFFWGMDEWVENGKEVKPSHLLSFKKANYDLCFDKIDASLRMPDKNLLFPSVKDMDKFSDSFGDVRCLVMQGGQGDIKHWAFNDPVKRVGAYADTPPSPEEYRKLRTRIVDLHPMTLIQNARTSAGGQVSTIPTRALTVGPKETWEAEKVSIWHSGAHDNAFGIRLTSFMISKRIADSSVPMSLLADHSNVHFNYYIPALGPVEISMH